MPVVTGYSAATQDLRARTSRMPSTAWVAITADANEWLAVAASSPRFRGRRGQPVNSARSRSRAAPANRSALSISVTGCSS
jgi:hypothetical protein